MYHVVECGVLWFITKIMNTKSICEQSSQLARQRVTHSSIFDQWKPSDKQASFSFGQPDQLAKQLANMPNNQLTISLVGMCRFGD